MTKDIQRKKFSLSAYDTLLSALLYTPPFSLHPLLQIIYVFFIIYIFLILYFNLNLHSNLNSTNPSTINHSYIHFHITYCPKYMKIPFFLFVKITDTSKNNQHVKREKNVSLNYILRLNSLTTPLVFKLISYEMLEVKM